MLCNEETPNMYTLMIRRNAIYEIPIISHIHTHLLFPGYKVVPFSLKVKFMSVLVLSLSPLHPSQWNFFSASS